MHALIPLPFVGITATVGYAAQIRWSSVDIVEHLRQHTAETAYILRGLGRRQMLTLVKPDIYQLEITDIFGKDNGLRPSTYSAVSGNAPHDYAGYSRLPRQAACTPCRDAHSSPFRHQ